MEIVGKSSFLWWSFLLLWVGFILLNWLTVLEERFFLVCFVLSFLLFFLFFPSKKNPSTAGKQKTTSWAVKSLLQHIYWSFCWTHVLFWFKPMLGCTVVFPSLYQFWRQGHVGQKDHSTRAATSILLLFEQHWASPEVKELGVGVWHCSLPAPPPELRFPFPSIWLPLLKLSWTFPCCTF